MSPSTAVAPRSRFLTAAQLAPQLGYRQTKPIFRLVHEEGLPARRAGRKFLFDPAEVDAWLDARGLSGNRAPEPELPPVDPAWLAEQLAKFSPDDIARAARVLLALHDARTEQTAAHAGQRPGANAPLPS